jgi:hypothetical protein
MNKTRPKNVPAIFISAVTPQGLEQLKDLIWSTLNG